MSDKKDKPNGMSKYQLKIQKRRKRALQLGLKPTATWPEIWAAEDAREA